MVVAIRKFLETFGVNVAGTLVVFGITIIAVIVLFIDVQLSRTIGFAVATSPIWLPIVLFFTFFEKWMLFVRKDFLLAQGNVTLEIILPEEIFKSPRAMELVIGHLAQKASPDNHIQTYWDGKHPPRFGLELVSDGGRVRFFINTPRKKFKNIIETQLYSQYPGIEVRELPVDYAAEVDKDFEEFDFFSIHFGLKKDSVYPIKTYIDYELDKDPKEEFKVDPLTQVLDTLAALRPGERAWIQILISAHRTENFEVGTLGTVPDWTAAIQSEINKIAGRDKNKLGPAEFEAMPRLTDGERDTIKALERSLSKTPFNTAIRVAYLAKKGHYDPGERIGALITMWFQFGDNMRNGIGLKWRTDVDWPWWQDRSGRVRHEMKKRELDAYKRRGYDNEVQGDKEFIMTNEELATIFHLPGKVALTPGIARIPSARAEAPANLPTGAL